MTEVHWYWGPFSLLIVGRVWAFDIGRAGIYGVGWRVRFRTVEPDSFDTDPPPLIKQHMRPDDLR